MKVLILINKVGLGDCIIHLNYIHEISKKYEKPVSILAKENTRAKDLFQDDPHIKEVITLDRLEDETGSHDGLNGFIKLIKDIKEKKFDKVFIFNSSVRYFLVCKFAGIKKIAQYPLFKKKGQHVVNTAKIFTESEIDKYLRELLKMNTLSNFFSLISFTNLKKPLRPSWLPELSVNRSNVITSSI